MQEILRSPLFNPAVCFFRCQKLGANPIWTVCCVTGRLWGWLAYSSIALTSYTELVVALVNSFLQCMQIRTYLIMVSTVLFVGQWVLLAQQLPQTLPASSRKVVILHLWLQNEDAQSPKYIVHQKRMGKSLIRIPHPIFPRYSPRVLLCCPTLLTNRHKVRYKSYTGNLE